MIKRWWRWLTYKRVFVVYDGEHISHKTMANMREGLERMRVTALILAVYGNRNKFEIYALDQLKPTEFKWLQWRVEELSKAPVSVAGEVGTALEFTESFRSYTPGKDDQAIRQKWAGQPLHPLLGNSRPSGVEAAVEAFKSEKYRYGGVQQGGDQMGKAFHKHLYVDLSPKFDVKVCDCGAYQGTDEACESFLLNCIADADTLGKLHRVLEVEK